MAVDFMVMPLSRYISGDFVTPHMRWSWEEGIPYFVLTPAGRRELPRGLPFGGAEASARRQRLIPLLERDLRALPAGIANQLWDEHADVEPRFHRVHSGSYQALLEHAARTRQPLHVQAGLMLPCDFSPPFRLGTPLEATCASAVRARTELGALEWPDAAAHAVDVLREALEDSIALRCPLVVDV